MHSTIFALKHAYHAARYALEIELQCKGLTVARLDVLKLLGAGASSTTPVRGVDQRALRAALGVTSATLTRLLAGMEQGGLVVRSPHATDARGKTVKITPKARRLYRSLMVEGEAQFRTRFLRGFTKAETIALTRALKRIAENMDGMRGL
jgi:DNA-binding MarR family transcriptional regulator